MNLPAIPNQDKHARFDRLVVPLRVSGTTLFFRRGNPVKAVLSWGHMNSIVLNSRTQCCAIGEASVRAIDSDQLLGQVPDVLQLVMNSPSLALKIGIERAQ